MNAANWVRCRVLISALADICLRRYIEKTCQGHGELSLKIQFRNSKVRELSENDISTISILKAQEFQKQYGKETVNLWKHLKKTEGTCTFNEAVHDILHLRELHKQMDAVLKAYGWEDIDLAHDFYEVDYLPENDRFYSSRSHLIKFFLNTFVFL
jgi:hypothetical protein